MECPVRVDNAARNQLFEEVQAATRSVDHMLYHGQAVYDRNQWCAYDVFLKAAWAYLVENGSQDRRVASVLLLKMVQLYRRRSGREHVRAAGGYLAKLKNLLAEVEGPTRIDWLRGIVAYEEAYLGFLADAASYATEMLFRQSEELERSYGRKRGLLVSKAQRVVATMRQDASRGAVDGLKRAQAELRGVRDELAGDVHALAQSWVQSNIPVHCAYAEVARGRHHAAIAAVRALADSGSGSALWYSGVAKAREGDMESGTKDLEAARRAFYRNSRAEGFGSLLVALGDAYCLAGRRDDAVKTYTEATRQPPGMDNKASICAAGARLVRLECGRAIGGPEDIYWN